MAASGDLRQAASSAALNSTDDAAVMRRVPIVGVVVLAALSVASAVLAVLLDLHQTRWPVTHFCSHGLGRFSRCRSPA
jgi:hypothetical protein